MNWNLVRKGLLGGAFALELCLSQIAPASATILDYTLTGQGSYFLGGGNTGGTFTFTWVGDTANIFGSPAQILVVPPASLNLTPFSPGPSNPVYNGTFTSSLNFLEVTDPSTPGQFASIDMTTEGGFGTLVELPPTGIDLSAPFSVTTSPINTNDAGSFLLVGSNIDLADGKVFQLEFLSNDSLTFSATVATTPLPSTWTMLIAGFGGLGFLAFRGSKKSNGALAAA